MDIGGKILSELQAYTKYGRYLEDKKRREVWEETVKRNLDMHKDYYGEKLAPIMDEVEKAYELVLERRILPSMRSAQFGGKPIIISPNRIYNCSYLPIDSLDSFSEAMFLLLGGSGVGFSVQGHNINKLPLISKPDRYRRFVIGDSKEGWADAVKVLFKAYFGLSRTIPRFDYSDIRLKGTPLVTSGGKAPGPKPLRDALNRIESILMEKEDGSSLSSIEAHDIMCIVGDAVLSGGIRRAALISLFDFDDHDMLYAKSGNWWELYPYRARANNSVVLERDKIGKEDYNYIFNILKNSGSGEPGFFWTNNKEWGTNPCAEISLRPFQFCNLTNVNMTGIETQEEFEELCKYAAIIGTLQAGYTDFHYLREIWKQTTEEDALIGVGLTGIASSKNGIDLSIGASVVKDVNTYISEVVGITIASRTTTVKPDGNTSVLLNTSPGIHAWHSKYFIRRVRINKEHGIYKYLKWRLPELVEDDIFNENEGVVGIPVKAPEGALLKSEETALELLGRVKKVYKDWVTTGHRSGDNTNNVSCTVNVKDNEWDDVQKWFWENRYSYNGLSILPHDNHTYKQAPYEEISEEEYDELVGYCKDIDLKYVDEDEDYSELQQEIACAGGACEI